MNSVLMKAYIAPPRGTDLKLTLAVATGEIFGGCTITEGYGYWTDGKGTVHMEEMYIVEVSISVTDPEGDIKRDQWFDKMNDIGKAWGQKAILYVTHEAQGNFWEVE